MNKKIYEVLVLACVFSVLLAGIALNNSHTHLEVESNYITLDFETEK